MNLGSQQVDGLGKSEAVVQELLASGSSIQAQAAVAQIKDLARGHVMDALRAPADQAAGAEGVARVGAG